MQRLTFIDEIQRTVHRTHHNSEKFMFVSVVFEKKTLDKRTQFDEKYHRIEQLYDDLHQQTTNNNDRHLSIEQHLNEVNDCLERLHNNHDYVDELQRLQRSLISQGHRIDNDRTSQLFVNIKHIEEQLHTERERYERALQIEHDYHRLENEFDAMLELSSEQLHGICHNTDDANVIYQVTIFIVCFLHLK
jgi:DNA repair exonuclease SbcCD ATPase subunit